MSKSIVAANIDCNLTKNSAIAMPVIQYAETNWDFIKRMASNCNACVMVDETKEKLKIIVGKGKGNSKGVIKSSKYTYGISDRYYEKKGFVNGLSKSEYEYIEIESKEVYDICDIVTFMDRNYYVCGKKGKLIEEEILYTYILGTEAFLYEKQYNNRRFAGCTILGDVVSTSNETLKLDLNLEDEEDSSYKYDYKWVPESGNVMYCMPKAGTTVSLYFYNESEKSAVAINCIRTNSGNEKVFTKEDKIFTTEHDKGFKLSKDAMHFVTEKEGEQLAWMSLIDKIGTFAITKNKISINAKVAIGLVGTVVKLDSKEKFEICQSSDGENSAEILAYYLFNISCKNVDTFFKKNNRYKIINDEPKEKKKFNWSKWRKNLLVGLVVVAVVTAAVAITVASCGAAGPVVVGAVVGGLSAGAFAVGSIQVGDMMSGEVTDTSKVAIKVAEETFVGIVTGALSGASVVGGKKLLEGAAKGTIKHAGLKKFGLQMATEEFNAASSTIVSNATDNALADNDADKKKLTEGLGWNMIFAGIFTGADNVNIPHTKPGAKGFDEMGDDMSKDILSHSDKYKKYSNKANDAEQRVTNNLNKLNNRAGEKKAYKEAMDEAIIAHKDAVKTGNKYKKANANYRIKKLQESLERTNQSIRDLKINQPQLILEKEKARVIREEVSKEILNKKGIGRGIRYGASAFRQPHTYVNVAKTTSGYVVRESTRDKAKEQGIN